MSTKTFKPGLYQVYVFVEKVVEPVSQGYITVLTRGEDNLILGGDLITDWIGAYDVDTMGGHNIWIHVHQSATHPQFMQMFTRLGGYVQTSQVLALSGLGSIADFTMTATHVDGSQIPVNVRLTRLFDL